MIEGEKFSLPANRGFGMDVATDREDDLDRACLAHVQTIVDSKAGAAPTLVMDVGGGNGFMSVKMANAGATVTLVDPIESPVHVANAASPHIRHVPKIVQHIAKSDVLGFDDANKVDIVYAQKSFHYMPYSDALKTLRLVRENYASRQCKLFISLSAVDCALGLGYEEKVGHLPITSDGRHIVPENQDAAHLGISHPMTLYRETEVRQLLEEAGFKNISITKSDYGTFKAIAENELALDRGASERTY